MAEPTIVEELEAARQSIADLTEKLTSAESSIAALSGESDVRVETIKILSEKAQADALAIASTKDALAKSESERAELAAKLIKAEGLLALDQFKDISGVKPVQDGGQGGQEKSVTEKFAAITDPKERTKFYRDNRMAILNKK